MVIICCGLGSHFIGFHHGPKLGTDLLITLLGFESIGTHSTIGVAEEAFECFELRPSNPTIQMQHALDVADMLSKCQFFSAEFCTFTTDMACPIAAGESFTCKDLAAAPAETST
jgi:hypothetical protein